MTVKNCGNFCTVSRLTNFHFFAVIFDFNISHFFYFNFCRGLDIPGVKYIVHYQLPRSSEIYVHRCGRTARAQKSGFSLALLAPEDKQTYRRLISSLGRDISIFETDRDLFKTAKNRIRIARKLDIENHFETKKQRLATWEANMAKEIGFDVEVEEETEETEVCNFLGLKFPIKITKFCV